MFGNTDAKFVVRSPRGVSVGVGPLRVGRWLSALAVALVLQASASQAGVVTYSASDAGAGPSSPRPNSNAMASTFDTAAGALGTVHVITFESAPVGAFSSLTPATGVTMTGADGSGGNQTIRDTPAGLGTSGDPYSIHGYNTTSGGSHFVYVHGGTLTFAFVGGVQAFGAYISGIQFSGETITFDDGSSQSVAIPALGTADGGIAFVGFTDAGKSITSITINATGVPGGSDFISIDDVRYVSSTVVPEAAPWMIWSLAGSLVGLWLVGAKKLRPASAV
ncbi:MAG: hypothetical protein JSS02_11415 [Planctomycetes bacterium]|nr:hypothetical protein [Planctomycetota bacterium]